MISEAERNYEPKTWVEVESLPEIVRPLGKALSFYICNSDSARFQTLVEEGIGHKAILIDYELLYLDLDPRCGSMFATTTFDKLIFTVFTDVGNRIFVEQ